MEVNLKLPKRASMAHFYYQALSLNTSAELAEFIKLNKWYFDKMTPEIQEQFRIMYQKMKKKEKK